MYKSITIVGNVGTEPEMRFTPSGKPVTTFSVAVNEKRGGDEETTWFRVATWGKLAEVCNQYLNKGRQVLVVGSPKLNQWEAKDGTTKASIEINAGEVKFLGKPKEQIDNSPVDPQDLPPGDTEVEPDNIPF